MNSPTAETRVVHYYAGWPGKVLCEGKTSLPVSPISSIRHDHVTCMECLRQLIYTHPLLVSAAASFAERRNAEDTDRDRLQNLKGADLVDQASVNVMLKPAITDEWGTPQWLFDALDKEFGFTLDPCSDGVNAKCKKFFTPTENGLLMSWGTETVFMNPPYSEVDAWMRKAYGAAQEGATVVSLIPARTDSGWWHEYAMKSEVRLIRGRLRFGDDRKRFGGNGAAPFPSAIIVMRPREFKLVSYTP